jgi:hypothetical protein
MTLLARAGYAARGVVYLIVAFFAVQAARGSGSNVSTEGAVEQMLDKPYGRFLMWAVVVGLLGYAAWRLIQAIADTDDHGSDLKGLVIRSALVGSAIANLLLALFALSLVSSWGVDSGSSGGGDGAGQDLLARLLAFSNANLVIYALALIPLGVAVAHWVKAWRASFERYFQCDEHVMRWVRPISQIGLAARGVVFFIIAALLFLGGSRYEPTDPPGVKESLDALQALPYGNLLLMTIGLGLAAFAIYSFAQARWRRIDLRGVNLPHSLRSGAVRHA